MIQDQLSRILNSQQNRNTLFIRTLLKEAVQDYVLNFVYNNKKYKQLIFTGGTCLRKIYGLPRLSEDLDFDFIDRLDIKSFSNDVKEYFIKIVHYGNLETKISNNKKTVFIKFPTLLKEISVNVNTSQSSLLFVRCDFSEEEKNAPAKTEINSISSSDFTFFVLSCDLSTLFANKIIAFLTREFFKGKKQNIPFKGRDLFDLNWFFDQSVKSSFELQPNWKRIYKKLTVRSKEQILNMIVKKTKEIREKGNEKNIYNDLLPFIESANISMSFSNNFIDLLETKIKKFITYST